MHFGLFNFNAIDFYVDYGEKFKVKWKFEFIWRSFVSNNKISKIIPNLKIFKVIFLQTDFYLN